MKAISVLSVLALAVVFTLIGWELFETWLLSLPPYHPYVWEHPHLIESLRIIPLTAFGISLIVHSRLLKPLFERFKRNS